MSVIIQAENLSCQSGRQYLINEISWTVHKGEHWIVFGTNGSGKTTLLSVIAGYKGYSKGHLEVFGQPYTEENVFDHRRRIGWVSSSFFDKYLSWESALTIVLSGVSGTLSLGRDISDKAVKRALQLLGQLGLGQKIDQPFALMSKGERQCVLLARALVSQPEILILDEPGTGLDVYARQYVLEMVADLAEHTEMTIIYVTHYAEEILPMFDQTLLLRKGRVVGIGPTARVFTDKVMSDFLNHQAWVEQGDRGLLLSVAVDKEDGWDSAVMMEG